MPTALLDDPVLTTLRRRLEETGEFLDAKPYLVTEWLDRTPLMGEIRR